VTRELSIREAGGADVEVLVGFNVRLAWESEQLRLDAATVRRGVERALQSPALCRYFVAERGGRVVGQTMVTFEVSDWRDGLNYWIQSVFVDEAERGGGVFRALYEHVVGLARASGDARSVKLYVDKGNAKALEVYERLGMTQAHYHIYESAPLAPY
jgi:GNAT superfamily N-acetyltransferase